LIGRQHCIFRRETDDSVVKRGSEIGLGYFVRTWAPSLINVILLGFESFWTSAILWANWNCKEDYCVRFGAASTFPAQPNSSDKEICKTSGYVLWHYVPWYNPE
jgi:hypothetical protein